MNRHFPEKLEPCGVTLRDMWRPAQTTRWHHTPGVRAPHRTAWTPAPAGRFGGGDASLL